MASELVPSKLVGTVVSENMEVLRHYILDGKIPRKVTLEEYIGWDQPTSEKQSPRLLFKTSYGEGIEISTVFLMLDHGFGNGVDPVLFQTVVFGGGLDDSQERYCTYEQAEIGHRKWCERVFKSLQGYPNEQSSSGD